MVAPLKKGTEILIAYGSGHKVVDASIRRQRNIKKPKTQKIASP